MSAEDLASAVPDPCTILNVDDTEVARYAKTRTLKHAGFNVIEAGTGAEALAQMSAATPPLVLLDVRLPDVNGIALCKTIKQRWPATLVLQTSATFVTSGDRVRGLEGGADSYLIQPIDPQELVAAVRALLRLHRAEEATRALNESLERRIEVRTRELHRSNAALVEQIAQRERAEAALVQSQKMEAVGQLTGSMAHDFNNILASVAGYVHLVRRLNQNADQRGLLDKALAAIDRGKRLTQRLLVFSRPDGLQTGAVDVRALTSGVREWLTHALGRSITLTLRFAAGDLVARTDANQLELALLNLVINARDALPAGGQVTITVGSQQLHGADAELRAGGYVLLTVGDDGAGMPLDIARRAFDPFFTTKPPGQGTGLGLAQVASLGRQSGGGVRMDSSPGGGTRVTLWLAAADPADLKPAPAHEPADMSGHGERLLVVDDEADIRKTVSEMLQHQHYRVAVAASGQECVDEIDRDLPDLLLLDLAMPGMSGLEVTARVRAQHPGLPILFMSGHAERDQISATAPGVRLLRKPFATDELFLEVRRTLLAAGRARFGD